MKKGKLSPVASQKWKQLGLPDGQSLLNVLSSEADSPSSIMLHMRNLQVDGSCPWSY